MNVQIDVAEDFSPFPGGRNPAHGEFNGETFRLTHLEPHLEQNQTLLVIFDGVAGLPSSFIEEAFGGLVRSNLIKSVSEFEGKIKIQANSPAVKNAPLMIERYIREALKQLH